MNRVKFRPWNHPRLWLGAAGVAALLLIILSVAGGFHRKVAPGIVEDRAALPIPPGAPTLEIRIETIRPAVEAVGTVGSEERVELRSQVNARVARVAAGAGDLVSRGQVLMELDDRELRRQLEAAEAELARAEADHRRTRELFQTEAATRRQLESDEAAFRGARARVEEMRVLVSHTRITSPIDGVVVDRQLEPGDLATVGTTLMTVYDPGRMRLEAPVPLRLAGRLRIGERLEVELGSPERVVEGTVREIVAAIDPRSRTRTVKVLLSKNLEEVLPGMFGRLRIPGDPRAAILIPASAVYRVGQLDFVQVRRGDRAARRIVRLGSRHGGRVEVLAGLADGESILATPVHRED